MSKSKEKLCGFCSASQILRLNENSIMRYLDPHTSYGEVMRTQFYGGNVQIDLNASYPSESIDDDNDNTIILHFNYCPMCGRRLD